MGKRNSEQLSPVMWDKNLRFDSDVMAIDQILVFKPLTYGDGKKGQVQYRESGHPECAEIVRVLDGPSLGRLISPLVATKVL